MWTSSFSVVFSPHLAVARLARLARHPDSGCHSGEDLKTSMITAIKELSEKHTHDLYDVQFATARVSAPGSDAHSAEEHLEGMPFATVIIVRLASDVLVMHHCCSDCLSL